MLVAPEFWAKAGQAKFRFGGRGLGYNADLELEKWNYHQSIHSKDRDCVTVVNIEGTVYKGAETASHGDPPLGGGFQDKDI